MSANIKHTPITIINHPYSMNANLQLNQCLNRFTVIAPNIYPTIMPITTNECSIAIHFVFDFLGENSLTHTGPYITQNAYVKPSRNLIIASIQ